MIINHKCDVIPFISFLSKCEENNGYYYNYNYYCHYPPYHFMVKNIMFKTMKF